MKNAIVIILILIIGAITVSLSERGQSRLPQKRQFSETILNSDIKFGYPEDYKLFASIGDMPVKSYIPPCGQDFDYCLYYKGERYNGTNFESAGIRIKKRTDLSFDQDSCLKTEPDGYSNLQPSIYKSRTYATATIAPLNNAGAGHSSEGELYRLFNNNVCYEFETRIGESQFGNYPAGSIDEFSESDRENLKEQLREVIDSISLPDNPDRVFFPSA